MAFWLFKKKIKISHTKQIRKRSKFLNIIVKGCVSQPAYEGGGPTLGICKTCNDVREAYLALRNLEKNV